jgi:uncharacterized protein YbjT (DUF2867 family)
MITVLGASGHTGSVIAERLLALEEFVRVVGRDERRLASFEARGAELAVGDIADTPFLTKALSGADAAWLLIPPAYTEPDYLAYMDRLAGSIEHAVRDSEISHVALLSSMGADLPEGTGLVTGLHAMEARLRELTAVNSLFLRAGYFYENLFGSLEFIAAQGVNGGVIAPDVPVTMVASRDVGEIAARALRSRDFSGVAVRSAVGPTIRCARSRAFWAGPSGGRSSTTRSSLPKASRERCSRAACPPTPLASWSRWARRSTQVA